MSHIPKTVIQLKTQFFDDMKIQTLDTNKCPKCGSDHIIGNGYTCKRSKRYRCKNCQKSFVLHTDFADDGSRKSIEIWDIFVDCMLDCMSYRKAAEICGIDKNTAFRWRHQLFESLEKLYKSNLKNIVSDTDSDEIPIDLHDLDYGYFEDVDIDSMPQDFTPTSLPDHMGTRHNVIRIHVDDWSHIYIKNAAKYRLWQKFVRDALASGHEKQYIGSRILKQK